MTTENLAVEILDEGNSMSESVMNGLGCCFYMYIWANAPI